MQAIKAIYDGVNFMPTQPIPVEGVYEVVITFIEQVDMPAEFKEVKKTDIEFWEEFDRLAKESRDEVLSMNDFPPTKFSRELIIFEDEDEEQNT